MIARRDKGVGALGRHGCAERKRTHYDEDHGKAHES